MSEDLKKLGFKCGVEIHQQLKTNEKLFCRCPAHTYSKEHDAEVLRHMRPTLSEMGVYDGCALMEFKTKKEIVYLLNKESVCTYEMDDTPPFPVNQQALDIAIEISLMLGCAVVDELHIARKQYLDGSIPTGFQRTGIVGVNGSIPYKDREIGILQLSIEEESCREVRDEQHTIFFRTDRLGIPLIEVVTAPDMKTPEEAAEVVRLIGRITRATGKVKTGLGSVRQDVNVSIEGGRRVEIKGVPRYQLIPDLTRIEAYRQKALLDIRNELNRRGITQTNLKTKAVDLTDELKNTRDQRLKAALEKGWRIRGIKLKGCEGLLNWRTQHGRTFASELAGRVRVIACLDHNPNLYHTDYYPEYTGSHIDYKKIRHHLSLRDGDVGVIVWGPEKDTVTATNEIRIRMEEATEGVPHETRQHLHGGLTDFERILPGADRMYPDTDHPPVRVEPERTAKIKASLNPSPTETEKVLLDLGMTKEGAAKLTLSPQQSLVKALVDDGHRVHLVERVLMNLATHLKRGGIPVERITPARYRELFTAYKEGLFHREAFEKILPAMARDTETPVKDLVVNHLNLKPVHDDDVVSFARGLLERGVERRHLLKDTAKHFRGRVSGKRIEDIVQEISSDNHSHLV
jgi:glutamyl-tRNA(Gln) amidotransferase subunit E